MLVELTHWCEHFRNLDPGDRSPENIYLTYLLINPDDISAVFPYYRTGNPMTDYPAKVQVTMKTGAKYDVKETYEEIRSKLQKLILPVKL